VSKTALIVDDSLTIRQLVSFTMKEAGFDVYEAINGQDGLTHLDGKAIQVIITDLNMPVMDGITFIRNIRANPHYKFTPILLLTTESQEGKKQEGKAAGATGWLVKPFDPRKLLQVLDRVVQ